jgi:putative hemolysin
MKTLLFTFMALVQTQAATQTIPGCGEQSVFQVEGKKIEFCWLPKVEAWVSIQCVQKKQAACKALALHQSLLKQVVILESEELDGGKNPGSVLCGKIGGTLQYAILEGGSQQTFCSAADGSLIDSNALGNAYYTGEKNKK